MGKAHFYIEWGKQNKPCGWSPTSGCDAVKLWHVCSYRVSVIKWHTFSSRIRSRNSTFASSVSVPLTSHERTGILYDLLQASRFWGCWKLSKGIIASLPEMTWRLMLAHWAVASGDGGLWHHVNRGICLCNGNAKELSARGWSRAADGPFFHYSLQLFKCIPQVLDSWWRLPFLLVSVVNLCLSRLINAKWFLFSIREQALQSALWASRCSSQCPAYQCKRIFLLVISCFCHWGRLLWVDQWWPGEAEHWALLLFQVLNKCNEIYQNNSDPRSVMDKFFPFVWLLAASVGQLQL